MVMQSCGKCYRVKELGPVHQDLQEVHVCTRCRWDIEEALGFLAHQNVEVTLSLAPEETPETKKTGARGT